jgi:hypothetical protein
MVIGTTRQLLKLWWNDDSGPETARHGWDAAIYSKVCRALHIGHSPCVALDPVPKNQTSRSDVVMCTVIITSSYQR